MSSQLLTRRFFRTESTAVGLNKLSAAMYFVAHILSAGVVTWESGGVTPGRNQVTGSF